MNYKIISESESNPLKDTNSNLAITIKKIKKYNLVPIVRCANWRRNRPEDNSYYRGNWELGIRNLELGIGIRDMRFGIWEGNRDWEFAIVEDTILGMCLWPRHFLSLPGMWSILEVIQSGRIGIINSGQ